MEMPRLVPCGRTTGRATTSQEYFWYTHVADSDPRIICVPFNIRLTGPLDGALVARALEDFVRAHSIYRTTYRELDGVLHQVILPPEHAAPFAVERADRPGDDAAAWDAAVQDTVDGFLATRFDIEHGSYIRARLLAHAPERHTLVIVLHHLVFDEHTLRTMPAEVFARYDALCAGRPFPEPALQYIDYTEALVGWLDTPTGAAQRAYWRQRLAGAAALQLPVDSPRDELVAIRDAHRHGIVAEPMYHPYHELILAPELKAAVGRVAAEDGVTTGLIYLVGYAWLLHHLCEQADVGIESTFSPWDRAETDRVQGLISTWTLFRLDIPCSATFRDALRRARDASRADEAHGPIIEYYQLLPHPARRASYQDYGPPPPLHHGYEVAPGLHGQFVKPTFPVWRKPWELHLSLFDHPHQTKTVWTGSMRLFRRETIARFAERYAALLAAGCGAPPAGGGHAG